MINFPEASGVNQRSCLHVEIEREIHNDMLKPRNEHENSIYLLELNLLELHRHSGILLKSVYEFTLQAAQKTLAASEVPDAHQASQNEVVYLRLVKF